MKLSCTEYRLERLYNRSLKNLKDTPKLISYIITIILAYLVIAPLVSMIESSLFLNFRDYVQGVGDRAGEFTTYYLHRTFVGELRNIIFYQPLINTLVVVFPMSILAVAIGTILAYLVVRTNIRCKKLIATVAVIPYILPSWTLALTWINIFKNRKLGGESGILESLGVAVPDWLSYGPIPIMIVMALHYYPFTFLLVGGALRDFDTRLEEAAEVLGATRKIILRRIVFSLVSPAIVSAWVLTIARGVGSFTGPAFLGRPINYHVLSTRLYSTIRTGSHGVAYVISIVMILLAMTFVYINNKYVGKRRSYVTISGKGSKKTLTHLGAWRIPVTVLVLLFLFSIVVMPFFIIGIETITIQSGNYSLSNFTLHFWIGESNPALYAGERGVLRNPQVWTAFFNSLRLGLFVALTCGLSGILIGYTVVRLRQKKSKMASIIDQISFLPYLMPSITFSAMYLSLFAIRRGPIPSLYGTFTLIVLVTAVKNLPFATRAGISGMMQLGHEIEEAAVVSGAGWVKRMKRIILPLQKSSLVSGMTLPFISAMRELSLLIILITPGTHLLTTLTFTYTDYGYYAHSNAVLLINIIVIMLFTLLIQKITGSEIAKGIGG